MVIWLNSSQKTVKKLLNNINLKLFGFSGQLPEYTQFLSFITLKNAAGVLSVESSLGAGPLSVVVTVVVSDEDEDEDEDSEEAAAVASAGDSSGVCLVLRLLLRRERERESRSRKSRRWRDFI